MGYLHQGMLAGSVEQVIAQLEEGELSAPITTLQGVVVVRLEERMLGELSEFDEVKVRAEELLRRELSLQQYDKALDRLRESASLKVNQSLIQLSP